MQRLEGWSWGSKTDGIRKTSGGMGTGKGKDTVAWTSPFHIGSCSRAAVHS